MALMYTSPRPAVSAQLTTHTEGARNNRGMMFTTKQLSKHPFDLWGPSNPIKTYIL